MTRNAKLNNKSVSVFQGRILDTLPCDSVAGVEVVKERRPGAPVIAPGFTS